MPTAVLSTHTGGFEGFTYRDLTDDIVPIVNHWKTLDLSFDAIYTGFLGSFEQIDIVTNVFKDLKMDGTMIAVDPVMADNGILYSIFPKNFPEGMRKLCSNADIIMPNITEAVLMLGKEYKEGPYTKEYIESLLKELGKMCSGKVVLTGVYFNEKELGAACYDPETSEIGYAFADRIEGYYHGTGDVFGSVLVSSLVNGKTLKRSTEIAVDFTVGSIRRTKDAGTDIRFGVNFEAGIPKLIRDLDL